MSNNGLHPPPESTYYIQIEADMLARATKHILASEDYVERDALAAYLNANDLTAAQLKQWEEHGLLFTFSPMGTDYYPTYAFVKGPLVALHPAIAHIIKTFEKKDGQRLSFWFSSVNGWLDGMRPQDALLTRPDEVIVAAKREVEAIRHG